MDNEKYLRHSIVTMNPSGRMGLSCRDVTIVDTEPLDEIRY
jgi:hypothetical protein